MPLEPYDYCPCGSGKKFKFCCMDIADQMEKVHRHRDHNQPRMALQVLDRLEKKHAENAWVLIERASVLLDEQEPAQAKNTLERLLESHPDHKLAIALNALASFAADGYDEAKESINSAFRQCTRAVPDILSGLALSIASLMQAVQKYLAARQFLTLAMRLAPEEDQEHIFLQLLQLDSNREIPYPLRSVHPLARYTGNPEIETGTVQAGRLADLGCSEEAGQLFTRLGEEEPDNAVLWQNAGICAAWAGDEESAADALHLAARLHDDFDTAVELETIAQLLDLTGSEDRVEFKTIVYRVGSVSKLLSLADEDARVVRMPIPPAGEDEAADERPDGVLQILDRPAPDEADGRELTIETIANVEAEVVLFDARPQQEEPARAVLSGFAGEGFNATRSAFEELCGEEIEPLATDEPEDGDRFTRSIPRQVLPLQWRWHIPPQTQSIVVEKLEREKWREVIDDEWANLKQEALQGKSPLEAAGDPDLKLPLTAAVYVLDSLCARNEYVLDVESLCQRLRIEPLRPIAVSAETPLNEFSSMQLSRLPVKQLTDSQLMLTLNRALLLHYPKFLYNVLVEAIQRPPVMEQLNLNRAYMTLVDLCGAQGRREEAFQWIEKGFEHAGTLERPFEQQLMWKLRELSLRLHDPDDPELMPLLETFRSKYVPKLPDLASHLDELCALYNVCPPWQETASVVTPSATAGTVTGGVWSPHSPLGREESESGGKKLWLPGQS